MRKALSIIIIIGVLIIFFHIGYYIIGKNNLPTEPNDLNILLPKADVYYNTIANVYNGGHICEYNDNILLTKSEGVYEVNLTEHSEIKLFEGFAKSLNVINDKVYYLNKRNQIYFYDSLSKESIKVKENLMYTKINGVGDMLYGYEGITVPYWESKFGAINIDTGERYAIYNMENWKTGTYYKNRILYLESRDTDNHVFVSYDLISKEKTDLFTVDDFAFTWVVDNDKVYYSYSDFSYEVIIVSGKQEGHSQRETNVSSIGIWEYDLKTNENVKIADVSESVLVKNIIGNKLIYSDGPENNYSSWYLLDLISGGTARFDCDGSCNEIYVAQDMIIIKSTKDGVQKYRFYDENGTYTGFEVLY